MPDVLPDLQPPPYAFERAYTEGSRTRRRRLRGLFAAGLAAVALLVSGLIAYVPGGDADGRQELITQPAPTSTPSPVPLASVEGIDYVIPSGWSTVRNVCYPGEHVVEIRSADFAPLCPMAASQRLTTAVTLSALNGPRSASFGSGARVTWNGQPAFIEQTESEGETTVILTLPWLNASVLAQSPDAATARALLDNVRVRERSGLNLPISVEAITIQSFAGQDGDGLDRSAVLRLRSDVDLLLADMRSLTPVGSTTTACSNDAAPQMAVLTVRGGNTTRTYLARFTGCGQLVGNTGHAFATSQRLLDDLRRLVPNSGL